MASPPVRRQTLHTFLRERTGLRVGEANAAAKLEELLTQVSEWIADHAAELVAAEGESTMQAEHVQAAYDAFVSEGGPGLLTPEGLHLALSGIDNEGFAEVIRRLRADLEERQ